MTPTNTEALAAHLEGLADDIDHTHFTAEVLEAAAELRRLAAVEAERDALRAVLKGVIDAWDGGDLIWFKHAYEVMDAARAAMKGTQ